MNNNEQRNGQLELSFNNSAHGDRRRRPQPRSAHAPWWFGRMRAAVDNAISWSSQPHAPQQTIQPALV